MALTDEDLKKMVKDYLKEDSPQLADVEPVISEEVYTIPESVQRKLDLSIPKSIKKVKVLTYGKIVTAEDGAKIPIVTRVTVDEDGKILRSTGN
ncbi:MAG TPA: hypothetical protein PLQ49_03655 [Methanothrix sp.]|nr:hypothetical protein [Methanothrix sp.]HRW82671.1 hypothetical protein [Methanothrix sp.]